MDSVDEIEQRERNVQAASSSSIWTGFYKKTIKERQDQLRQVFPKLFSTVFTRSAISSPALPRKGTPDGNSNHSKPEAPILPSQILRERSQISFSSLNGTDSSARSDFPLNGLDEDIAENMVENCVG
jgi:hypothetical protein